MRDSRLTRRMLLLAIVILGLSAAATFQLPAIGAGALLHPARRTPIAARPANCRDVTYGATGVQLRGWHCGARSQRRGTLVYLHGVADNRASGVGVIDRFSRRGFDVIAYDSRAHGESEGEACTYGFYEKDDLRAVLDTIAGGPVVLLGTSLGAAVALQTAAMDSRITALVAAETFSDLATIASDRAPFFFSQSAVRGALQLAEQQARFDIASVSPVKAATTIAVPVLLVHGEVDSDTSPDHSRRVYDAIAGPKRLLIVPGARHNASLRAEVWGEIESWIDDVVPNPQ